MAVVHISSSRSVGVIRICAGHHWFSAKSVLDLDILSFSYDHLPQEHGKQGDNDDADMICVQKKFDNRSFQNYIRSHELHRIT